MLSSYWWLLCWAAQAPNISVRKHCQTLQTLQQHSVLGIPPAMITSKVAAQSVKTQQSEDEASSFCRAPEASR